MKKVVLRSLFVCFVSVAQLSSAQQNIDDNNSNPASLQAERIDLQEIKSLVDFVIETHIDVECDQVSQCQSIGLSPAPCGGYNTYLIYSNKNTDVIQLRRKVNSINQKRAKQIDDKGLVGICQYIAKPKLKCSANRCIAQSDNKM